MLEEYICQFLLFLFSCSVKNFKGFLIFEVVCYLMIIYCLLMFEKYIGKMNGVFGGFVVERENNYYIYDY